MSLSDKQLDAKHSVTLCRSVGGGHSLYLSDHRIVGGKPDYRGNNLIWEKQTRLRDIINAFPELKAAIGN